MESTKIIEQDVLAVIRRHSSGDPTDAPKRPPAAPAEHRRRRRRVGRRVVAGLAGVLLVGPTASAAPDGTGGTGTSAEVTALMSIASDGTHGNGASFNPTISADGTTVAFASFATNLVPNDTNDAADVFVHDRHTGRTTRVSVASGGTEGDRGSFNPSISADGRFVAFESDATGLTGGDHNAAGDVFVHDRETGRTGRVSVASDGTEGGGASFRPSISGEGRFVAFVSFAINLVPGDSNGVGDVFVRDRQAGRTARVSVASNGSQGDAASLSPSISSDGTTVAFASSATNLVTEDTNDASDVFVHNGETGRTTRVSVALDGSQNEQESFSASMSGDGRTVAFLTDGALTPEDTNHTGDIFVYDRDSGAMRRASVPSQPTDADGPSFAPSISGDGTVVAFASLATNLVVGDANATVDVFWRRPADNPPPAPAPPGAKSHSARTHRLGGSMHAGSMEAAVRAIVGSHRREIVRLVRAEELTAGQIAAHFEVSRPAISQHLRLLRDAGLVTERRQGTKRLYRAQTENLTALRAYLEILVGEETEAAATGPRLNQSR